MLKVKRIIEQSGRSLESLSRACAISISRFTEALSDNSWSLVEISQIAKVLNLSLEDLLLESVDDSRVEFAFRSSIPVCDDSVPFFELERLRKYVHSAFMMLGEESISPLLPGNLADSPEELAIKFRAMYFPDNPIGPIIDLPARSSALAGVFRRKHPHDFFLPCRSWLFKATASSPQSQRQSQASSPRTFSGNFDTLLLTAFR